MACHNGPAAGGSSFRKMGVVEPYRTDNPAEGRVAVTGRDADRFNFKVPTLRNVELTYPYFHDGAAATLTEAVNVMGRVQLGTAIHRGGECADRRVPEDADRRSAGVRAAAAAAFVRPNAEAGAVRRDRGRLGRGHGPRAEMARDVRRPLCEGRSGGCRNRVMCMISIAIG